MVFEISESSPRMLVRNLQIPGPMPQHGSQSTKVPFDTVPARGQPDGAATATCPGCGRVRNLATDGAGREDAALPVTCSCGLTFWVFLEHRRAHRRAVQLAGTFHRPAEDRSEIAFISNLSMTGVGFNTSGGYGLTTGAELMLHFTPDDGIDEEIQAPVVVKHVRNNYLGCQFMNLAARDEERLAGFLALIP